MSQPTTTAYQISRADLSLQFGRWISLGAVAGPILFMLAWIVFGLLQPTRSSEYGLMGGVSGAITNPISSLGVGPNARQFNLAFVLCGVTTMIGVAGTLQIAKSKGLGAPRIVAALLLLSPAGLAMAGVFDLPTSVAMHNVAALLVFFTPVFSFAAAGTYFRRIPGWRRFGSFLVAGSPLTLLLTILFVMTFRLTAVTEGRGVAGLTERILMTEIHCWYVAIGWLGFRD